MEPLTGNETIRRGYASEAYLDSGGTEKDEEFPAKLHGVKRVSALYQLHYWRVSPLPIFFFLFVLVHYLANILHLHCMWG